MKMIHLIRRKYMSTSAEEGDSFREVSLVRVLMYFPLDVIFHLSVSKHTDGEPSCSDLDEDPYGFYEALERHLPQLTLTVDVPWMRRIVYSPLALRLFGPKESDKQGMGSVMRCVEILAWLILVREERTRNGNAHDIMTASRTRLSGAALLSLVNRAVWNTEICW